jgi:diacylglycerol kinase (ATP)
VTLFIVNPAAGHGRAARRWARARARATTACPDAAVWTSTAPGEAASLARRGLEAGFTVLVAVGGDGTLGEVVDGVLAAPPALRAPAAVATWPAGSGCDFARAVGIRRDPAQLAALLARRAPRRLDAGCVTSGAAGDGPRRRHFVNMAAIGIATDVTLAVGRHGPRLGGTLSYLVQALAAIARARPRRLALTVDGVAEPPAAYHLVVVANTRMFGGGMAVAPDADPADGRLDLVTVGAVGRGALLGLLARAYSGAHVGQPGVAVRRVRRVEVTAAEPWPLTLDGDLDGTLPAVVEVLPGALPVLVPDDRDDPPRRGGAARA